LRARSERKHGPEAHRERHAGEEDSSAHGAEGTDDSYATSKLTTNRARAQTRSAAATLESGE
jgi:hypothetical protein